MRCAATRRKKNRRGSQLPIIVGNMGHVHPSMFARPPGHADLLVVKKLASLFILWVSLAAMAVTSALMDTLTMMVMVSVTYQSGSLNGDLRSKCVRANASKSGTKSTPKTFFTARFVA